MLCISVEEFLLWKRKQLSKGGDQQSFEVLLDCVGDISTRDLNLKILNPKGNLHLKKNLEFLESVWEDHLIRSCPIQYLCGITYWRDLKLKVTNKVLIPRPETELIVDIVFNVFRRKSEKLFFAELGTGSGAISIALALAYPFSEGVATDIDQDALEIANKNYINCVSNQIHSNVIVFGSYSGEGIKTDADGLVGNKCNQNLWVYTADCMPIFFADKRTRNVATLHCGRKGLEKKIIKNLVKIFDNLGTSRDNLLVAIGPAISKEHYLVDKMTLKDFYRKAENKNITVNLTEAEKDLCFNDSNHFKKQNLNQLDLKRSAYKQLLNENIPNTNIDISNLCTYKLKNEFNSWRRSKAISRQWNLICS